MIVKINTHPIVVGQHEEYHIDWCGKIKDVKPKIKMVCQYFLLKDMRVEQKSIQQI